MAKLNTETARKVDEAEDGFKPVPDGVYIVELREDVDVREGEKGVYWSWNFEIPTEHDGKELDYAGRRFWHNTSLSDAAYFKLKETFAAFGVPTTTDTEDLVKRRIKVVIRTEIQQRGKNKGKEQSVIDQLLPLNADVATSASTANADSPGVSTAKGGSDEEPMF